LAEALSGASLGILSPEKRLPSYIIDFYQNYRS
jgi:hypothetical protein